MKLRRIIFAFLFSVLCYQSSAQSNHDRAGYGIEVNFCAGKVIPNNIVFPPLPALSTALDIAFVQQTSGKRDWQQRRRYPLLGLGPDLW